MALTNAQKQSAHRARVAKKLSRAVVLENGLQSIIAELEGNDKPMAIRIRQIATEALKEG